MAAFLAGLQESRRLVSGTSSSVASSSATSSLQNQHQHHQRTTRTPSTCSQVSELDEDEELEEEEQQHHHQQTGRNMSSHAHRAGAYLSFGSPTTSGGQQHPSLMGGAQKQQLPIKPCFKQLLQSIPVPLAATSIIITTLILCSLLLSECKSLQLSGSQAAPASQVAALEMPPESTQELTSGNIDDGLAIVVESSSRDNQNGGRFLERERELLRRELLGELVGFQQQQQVANKLAQQQQLQRATNKRTNSHSIDSNREQQQQQVGHFNTLGALLMGNSGSSSESQELAQDELLGVVNQQQPDERYLDGTSEMELVARPAHMRSSPLAIELPSVNKQSHHLNQQQQQQHQPPHQYQHHNNHHQPNNNKQRNNNNHNVRASSSTVPASTLASAAQQEEQAKQLAYNHERPFDVAQIQCNNTDEGFERFACPTPDMYGRFRCIEDRLFCDGYYDCPGGEDEQPVSCMYYKLFVSHIDILTNTFLTWMKKQNRQSAHRSDVGLA